MSTVKRSYPGLEQQLGVAGSLLQVDSRAHVAVILQSLRAGWSTCQSGECGDLAVSGQWALEFHRAVQDEFAEYGCGDHCLTIVSIDGRQACASTMSQPARPSARFAYSHAHRPLFVRGEEVISDVTGRWCTSMFTPSARSAFVERVRTLESAGADEAMSLISEAGSFGAGVERHQILCELWQGDHLKLQQLRLDGSWYLDELAHLEHMGHELWLPEPDILKGREPARDYWLSTKVFLRGNNPRSWEAV